MKLNTKQRKKATQGFRQMTGRDMALNNLSKIMIGGKQAMNSIMLEMGRVVVESLMLIEREELAGPDYYPTDPNLQKWAHEEGSVFIGDQKVKVNRPRLRDVVHGEISLKKMVELTGQKLQTFKERSLADFKPFSIFLDTIHRGDEAFLVGLGIDEQGEKMALGFWQGSSENHVLVEELFQDLERRGLSLTRRILFVTDGGSGIIKALRGRFGKKLLHQRCSIHKSRNLQKHLPKKYRREAHRRLSAALEQNNYIDARAMLLELEQWLRVRNESAADSLLEAFEELLTVHRLKVPALLRKTLLTTNPIESMFSLVRHSERNLKRSRGSKMLQRWLGTVLLYCENQFRTVKGFKEIAQVIANIEAEQMAQPELKKAA
jgi:hypothetical protein